MTTRQPDADGALDGRSAASVSSGAGGGSPIAYAPLVVLVSWLGAGAD